MLDNANARAIASKVVDPLAKALLRVGLTANAVTLIASLTVSTIVLATWSRGEFAWGLVLCAPMVFGDLLDGTMARLSGQTSAWGSFLDSVMDRVTDAAILAAMILYVHAQGDSAAVAAGLVALASTGLIPYIRAKAESLSIECKVGLMERSERLFVMGVAGVFAAFGVAEAVGISLFVLALLNSFTVLQRLLAVRKGISA